MNQQRGSALIISLMILLVMTIIGISAMSSSTLEEKMAASDRNQKVVFQNAETSLKQTETTLLQTEYNTIREKLLGDQKGFYTVDDQRIDYFKTGDWANANCTEKGDECYVVEENSVALKPGEVMDYDATSTPERGNQLLKITVRRTDENRTSAVILQSSLQKTITY